MEHASMRVRTLLEPVVAGLGYELVGIEYLAQGQRSVLRIYIDHPDGIGVDDCERVSRQVGGVLDVENPIQGAYALEVSSPGLDRPLYGERDFVRFTGARAKIRLRAPLDGRRKFKGVVRGLRDRAVLLEEDGEEFSLPLEQIEKANLIPEI